MKKVLIITYYWPPNGGAGVQRWLKFAKYLKQFGWEPIIYTPKNPEIALRDESLLSDINNDAIVIKNKIWEPYTFYKFFIGVKKNQKINSGFLSTNKKPELIEKVSRWVRGNFFIPDARKFWIKPSVIFISKLLKNNKIDAIVSTGPPHSMHIIALKINKIFNIPWIADFRDPWTDIDFYDQLLLSKFADKKHHELEHDVLSKASEIVVVSNLMREDFNKKFSRKYNIITNGYDDEDLLKKSSTFKTNNEKFVISHIGSINKARNHLAFWQGVAKAIDSNNELSNSLVIKLIGSIDLSVFESINKYNLTKYVEIIDYIPHDRIIEHQKNSSILLLLINNAQNSKSILTGKLFEYLAAQRPILCIGNVESDVSDIINKAKAGKVVDFYDSENITKALLSYYELWEQKLLNIENNNIIIQYSRKELTRKLANLLDKMCV